MLAIHDGLAKCRFALLKQFRITPFCHRGRLKTQHGAQGQRTASKLPLRHRHDPVGGKKLVATTRTALLLLIEKSYSMQHEHPIAAHGHKHGSWSRIRLSVRAGTGMAFD